MARTAKHRDEAAKHRRARNLALGLTLGAVALMFYLLSIVRLGVING